jgi:hypothetical protein
MPQSTTEFIWWAFNGVALILLFFVRNDLKEIKTDIKSAKETADNNAIEVAKHKATCDERHKRLDYEIADIKGKV